MILKSKYLKMFRVTCDDLCGKEEASLVRQRSVSCLDISKDLLVDSENDTEENLFDTKMSNQQSIGKVGKFDGRIFSDLIRKQCCETESGDVINWALGYLEQLFVLLAQESHPDIVGDKTNSDDLLTTILEELDDSSNMLQAKESRLSIDDEDKDNHYLEKTKGSVKCIDKEPVIESESRAEQLDFSNKGIETNDNSGIINQNNSDEKDTRSKIESIILNMYDVFVDNIPEPALQHSMNKVHPLLRKLKDIITLELSTNYSRLNKISSEFSTTPSVSGPPPPAPPPPPPPKEIVLIIKVKTMGETLSEAKSIVVDGSSDIELRIKSQPKKDDMMAELKAKLQARQRRESLALKVSTFK